jgi:hypothetical protein
MKTILLFLCLLTASALSQTAAVLKHPSTNNLSGPITINGGNDVMGALSPSTAHTDGHSLSVAFQNADFSNTSLTNRLRQIYFRSRCLQLTLTPPPGGPWTDVIVKCLGGSTAYIGGYNVFVTTMDRTLATFTNQTHTDAHWRAEIWTATNPLSPSDARQKWIMSDADPNPIGYYVGPALPWKDLTGIRITFFPNNVATQYYNGADYWVVLWTNLTSVYQIGGKDAWLPVTPTLVPVPPPHFNYAAILGIDPPVGPDWTPPEPE